ncbi:MAG: FliM/FliN family flagellar motor switch protein [Acidobacteriota bacterium]
MASHRRLFNLWFEIMREELEELVHVPVTSQAIQGIPSAARAYRSQLSFEGPVHGVMYVTASSSSLVQLSQMVAGEILNPQAMWTEEGLEVWQIWLTATSGKLATRLSEEIGDSSRNACTIVLQGTTAVDGTDPAASANTTASGAAIQEWILRAAEAEFALSVSVQVMFPGDDDPAIAVSLPEPEKSSAAPAAPEMPDEPLREPIAATPLPEPPSAGRPDPPAAQPINTQAHVDPSASPRKASETREEDPYPYSEPQTKQRLDLLLDIELEATLRFGALELPLREVLELGPGDVLPLDRHVREPVELVVGDRIVAKGEVVLVGGNFALHVTEVAEPRRRLETIRCLF